MAAPVPATLLLCLAAWMVLGRGAAATPPQGDGGEEPPPPPSADFSQHEVLPDAISQEFLQQHILDSVEDAYGSFLPVSEDDGTPGSRPFGPRGRPSIGIPKRPFSTLKEFPPACPSPSNIGSLCSEERKRLVFGPWNLPQTSFSHLTRQGETLNNLEAEIAICCRMAEKEQLPCCSSAWKKGLLQFCKWEFSIKTRPYHCCREASDEDRLTCFANQSPFPSHRSEVASVNLAEVNKPLLDFLCSPAILLRKTRVPIPALIQNITSSCCQVEDNQRVPCAEDVKGQFIATLCGAQKNTWKDPEQCCSQADAMARNDCFNRNYLGQVSLLSSEPVVSPTTTSP